MQQSLQPPPAAPPTPADLILHHYLAEALTIQQIAGAVNLSIPAVLDVLQSPRTHAIIRQLLDAELQRQELLRTIAVTRALHTLTTLTDPEVCGTDRSLELQRKASAAILREAASTARGAARHTAAPATSAPRTPISANATPESSNPSPSRGSSRSLEPSIAASSHAHKSPSRQQRTKCGTRRDRYCNSSSFTSTATHHCFALRSAPQNTLGHEARSPQPSVARPRATWHRNRLPRPIRATDPSARARSPPEHTGRSLRISMIEKFGFFLLLCWHRAVPEACSVWSGRIARSRGIGSCCAAPRTWSAFSKGREVRCEECSQDCGRGCCARARWRGSGRLGLLVR